MVDSPKAALMWLTQSIHQPEIHTFLSRMSTTLWLVGKEGEPLNDHNDEILSKECILDAAVVIDALLEMCEEEGKSVEGEKRG